MKWSLLLLIILSLLGYYLKFHHSRLKTDKVVTDGKNENKEGDWKESLTKKIEESSVEEAKNRPKPYVKKVINSVNLINQGRYSDGLRGLLGVLEKDPKNELALEELGLYYLEEGADLDKAEEFFLRLYHANQDNITAFSELIYVLEQNGGSGKVEKFLKKVLDKNPNSLNNNMAYAQFLSREGRISEAVIYFEKMNEMRPNGGGAEDLAYIYGQNGDFQKSAMMYEEVIGIKEKMLKDSKESGANFDDLSDDLFRTKIEYSIIKMKSRDCQEARKIYSIIKEQKTSASYLKFLNHFKENCQ